ncbi:MAG: DUF362 domain-containing protein [archaeon]
MAKVSVAECPSYDPVLVERAIKTALKKISFSFSGGTVLIKPNLLLAAHPDEAITTHPSVVAAVCRLLRKRGCRIIIAESMGPSLAAGREIFRITGMDEVIRRFRAEPLFFENTVIERKPVKGMVLSEVPLSARLREIDYIVNLPKLKTHALTRYTGAVKNLYGFLPGGTKSEFHRIGKTAELFSQLLLDIYTAFDIPIIAIMDGVIGLEGYGPGRGGHPRNTGLILASQDCLALDIVASERIGFGRDDVLTNRFGLQRGLTDKPEEVGSTKRVDYDKPRLFSRRIPAALLSLFQGLILARPVCRDRLCIQCKKCRKACPVGAISMRPYPRIAYGRCIKCYCCYELCPEHAIRLRQPVYIRSILFTKKLIRKVLHL